MFIKDINFFDRHKELERKEKTVSKEDAIKVIVLGVLFFGVLIGCIVLNILKIDIKQELIVIDARINNSQAQEKLIEHNRKQELLENVTNYRNALVAANDKLSTLIKPTSKIVQVFEALLPNGMKITSFNYQGGIVTLQCSSNQEDHITNYIQRLRSTDKVHSVAYSGFTKGEEASYSCTITLTMMPGGAVNESTK